jgi:hypothetical protein
VDDGVTPFLLRIVLRVAVSTGSPLVPIFFPASPLMVLMPDWLEMSRVLSGVGTRAATASTSTPWLAAVTTFGS